MYRAFPANFTPHVSLFPLKHPQTSLRIEALGMFLAYTIHREKHEKILGKEPAFIFVVEWNPRAGKKPK
jgi:hypothetical protein